MAGTIVCDNITNGSAQTGSTTDMIKGSARAWVNFNGTGTVAIRASYNVSSITDNGTGNYTVNFTNAMSDANYSQLCNGRYYGGTGGMVNLGGTYSVNGFNILLVNPAMSANYDSDLVCVSVFR